MNYAKGKIAENLHVPEIVESVRSTGTKQLTQFEKRFPYLRQTFPTTRMTDKQKNKLLKRIEKIANWLDNAVPGSPVPFGLDSILGFIPVIGGSMSGILSLYQVYISTTFGIPLWLLLLFLFNIVVDFIFSLVPIAGGFLHMFYKANIYNYHELRDYLDSPEYLDRVQDGAKDPEITWRQLGADVTKIVPNIPSLAAGSRSVHKKAM